MKIELTKRQKEIVKFLRSKGSEESQRVLRELENEELDLADVEVLCTLLNGEFLMEGIFPNFEPNPYGLELEMMLDVINKVRTKL